MFKPLRWLALTALALPAYAEYHSPLEYGVATTINFSLYNTDGTLDVDEADGGAEVTLYCDEAAGATATNDFVDEGTFYSLALTAAEMQCARLAVSVAATDLNVIHISTFGNASAHVDYDGARLTAVPWNAAWDAEVESEVDDSLGGGTGTALTAIPWNASWDAEVESEVDDSIGGGTGTALTAIPYNSAWDAEIQSEATDALNAYDPPTRAELTSDIGGLNDLSAAQVNTEVDTAIETYHLDHLLASDYDPASQPGVATALFNELIEDDSGVSRYTVNALEQGPSGSGASAASIADAVWDEARSGHTTAGSFGERVIADTDYWNGAEITTSLETSADIADAVLDEDLTAHQTSGTLGAAIGDGDSGAGMTEAGGTGDQLTALDAEVTQALEADHLDHLFAADYDPASPPGSATAWANELVESDAGVTRYTVNALEQGPSGSGASAASIADAVWDEAQADHTTAGSFGETATEIASVLTDTNELQTDDVPGLVAALNDLDAAGVRSAVGLASANLDTQLTTIDDYVDTEVAAILDDTGTSGVVVATNAIGSAQIAVDAIGSSEIATTAVNEVRDSIMDYTIDDSITFEQAACYMLAVLAGEAAYTAGSPDQTVFQDPSGTDNRVTFEYGTDDGDRTSVTLSSTNCGS